MDEYLSEQEQIQRLREWWSDNGWFIVGGVALGVGALVGWNQYQSYLSRQSEAAAVVYLELQDAVEDGLEEDAISLSTRLSQEYPNTPYADQAGLALGRLFMEASEPAKAADALRGVMETTSDPELALIARLRLARVLAYLEQYDDALSLIDGIDAGRFRSRYSEVMGDIHVAQGNVQRARAAYGQALSDTEPGLVDRVLVQMKLDDLPAVDGDAVAPPAEQPAATAEDS